MIDLPAIQNALRQQGLDGWLLADFRGTNPLARRVLKFPPSGHSTRRYFYAIPAEGEPRKLVHRIEPGALDHLPGSKQVYLAWQELEAGVKGLLSGMQRVAMEYSPRNAIPYIAKVDAGTIELVRSFGVEVISSGDLVQQFEATWDDEQWSLHQEAERGTTAAYAKVWAFIAAEVGRRGEVGECEVQKVIMDHFASLGLVTDHPPIVGANGHAGDPHYEPRQPDTMIREGDLVLVDLWAKRDRPRAVYSDLTRMGFVGREVPERFAKLFAIVAEARDAAIHLLRSASASGRRLQGWEVDHACRAVIEAAGYGPKFCHRTGHSIGQETHGNGANIDDLETHEERSLLPRTCFSIEPGIYLDDCGFRSEVNVYIDAKGEVHVTGGPVQQRIVAILGE